jgi:uncharacterized delta-60 repeat protein
MMRCTAVILAALLVSACGTDYSTCRKQGGIVLNGVCQCPDGSIQEANFCRPANAYSIDGGQKPQGYEASSDGGAHDAGAHENAPSIRPIDSSDPEVDAMRADSATPITADNVVDSSTPITTRIVSAQVSAAGNDRFYGVTYDSAGSIFAVGQTSSSTDPRADYSFLLAKFSHGGDLDTSFGSGGYAIVNVVEGGGVVELARAVVVQADGRIVVAGNAEHAIQATPDVTADADIFLIRFNRDGTVDNTFGTNGVQRHDIGTGVVTRATLVDGGVSNTTLSGADSMWSLSQTLEGKLIIHTNTIAEGTLLDGGLRTDSDYALVRLTVEGQLDITFGSTGIVRTDFNHTNAAARMATPLPNGSIVGFGYTTSTILTGTTASAQQPVLYKVNGDGTPETLFGTHDPIVAPGVFYDFSRADQKSAEVHGASLQLSKFVTLGYGPTPGAGAGTDWVWLRFNGDGTPDRTFGTFGTTFQDPGAYSDQGRALITLPNNKVLGVGAGRPASTAAPATGTLPPSDGMVGVLTENGQPDTSFGPGGYRLFDFGGGSTDQLWAVALSPDNHSVAAVGAGNKVSETEDEDATLLILPTP